MCAPRTFMCICVRLCAYKRNPSSPRCPHHSSVPYLPGVLWIPLTGKKTHPPGLPSVTCARICVLVHPWVLGEEARGSLFWASAKETVENITTHPSSKWKQQLCCSAGRSTDKEIYTLRLFAPSLDTNSNVLKNVPDIIILFSNIREKKNVKSIADLHH